MSTARGTTKVEKCVNEIVGSRFVDGRRRRRALLLCTLIGAVLLVPAPVVAGARSRVLCVGAGAGCAPNLQSALDASRDGDLIRLGRGDFGGGVTVTTSVTIVGAGATLTKISGGGPVVTIGTFEGATQPTVVIKGVTITGGVTTSGLDPTFSTTAFAFGGGVEIPRSANGARGATVRISDSVISGNRVAPSTLLVLDPAFNVGLAQGGGIDNWGALTLSNSTVSGNQVTGTNATDANGAGIMSSRGSLVLNNTVVSGNSGTGTTPNGRFADTGGIYLQDSTMTMSGGQITGNTASLTSEFAPDVFTTSQSGAVHVNAGSSATVSHVHISGNVVTSAIQDGTTLAFAGAIESEEGGTLTLSDSVVSDNRVVMTGNSPSSRPGDFLAASGALDLGGAATIVRTVFDHNVVEASASTGPVFAVGGAISTYSSPDQPVTITDSVVSNNRVTASSTTGSAFAFGGGIENNGTLTIRRTVVRGNAAIVDGPGGAARGGGIYNSTVPDIDQVVNLTLVDTLIVDNHLTGSVGATVEGAGLYTTFPVTTTRTRMLRNSPDQCVGCD